jgi:hypothetical protein
MEERLVSAKKVSQLVKYQNLEPNKLPTIFSVKVEINIASNSPLCYVRFVFHLFETSSILQRYLRVTLKYFIKKIVSKRSLTHFKIVHPFNMILVLFFTMRKLTSFNDHLIKQNALTCLVDISEKFVYFELHNR